MNKNRNVALSSEIEEAAEGLDFTLDAGVVRGIISVDAGSFQQWLARGLLKFDVVRAGRRTFRKFHVSMVPRLTLISEIWKNGVLVGEAISVADRVLEYARDYRRKHPDPKMEQLAPLQLIAWFRQANLVYFGFVGDNSLRGIFEKEGYASCIIIDVETLKKHISEAVVAAKKANEGHL